MRRRGFSATSLSLNDSITHGTRSKVAEINERLEPGEHIIDLSIGTLDLPADGRIDQGVCDFIQQNAETIHAFAPVKGFPFLRSALAAKIERMHGVEVDPDTELMVTPGGIKGALTIMFHTLLDPGDEAVVPLPNWPHYGDMLRLHGAIPRFVPSRDNPKVGLTAHALEENISEKTKLVILGDCINPTGKVYSNDELRRLAQVIATHNVRREAAMKSPIHVIFDCPYEAHVLGPRPLTFAAIEVDVPGHGAYAMRQCTAMVTGPGKTYGMHGDRIGYIWATKEVVDVAARVQVNTNSFASTYGQIATHLAVQEEMDEVALGRATHGRASLKTVLDRLRSQSALQIDPPDGGYFLFVNFSSYAALYERCGYERADMFLLHEARVATISGCHFAEAFDEMRHFVRINCGRSMETLDEACTRILDALSRLESAGSVTPKKEMQAW